MDNTTCFVQDPDIGGIGVRYSFYLQALVLVFLIASSFKDASGSLWTLVATSLGLQIAAVFQYRHGSLTLFQAVQVSNLVWLANTCIIIGLASYSRGRRSLKHDFLVQVGAMVEMYFSIILSLLLWASASSFKNDPCASVTPFIVVWKSVPATRSGRWINIAFVSCVALVYTYVTVKELKTRWFKPRAQKAVDGIYTAPITLPFSSRNAESHPQIPERKLPPELQVKSTTTITTTFPGLQLTMANGIAPESPSSFTRRSPRQKNDPSQSVTDRITHSRKGHARSWQWSHIPPIFFSIAFFTCVVSAYFIAMNELLLRKSAPSAPGQSQWSFGQVLALIVILPSIVTLFQSREREEVTTDQSKGGSINGAAEEAV